jgi:hypothetical protein
MKKQTVLFVILNVKMDTMVSDQFVGKNVSLDLLMMEHSVEELGIALPNKKEMVLFVILNVKMDTMASDQFVGKNVNLDGLMMEHFVEKFVLLL